jgi:hypothetical protein
MLCVLSWRIRSGEFSAHDLADECIGLASASHSYEATPNIDGSNPDINLGESKWWRDYQKWDHKYKGRRHNPRDDQPQRAPRANRPQIEVVCAIPASALPKRDGE